MLVQCKWGVVLIFFYMKHLLCIFLRLLPWSVLAFFLLSWTWHYVWKEHLQCLTNMAVWRHLVFECFASCPAFISAFLWMTSSQFMHPVGCLRAFFFSYLTSKLASCLCSWSLACGLVSLGVNGVNSISVHQLTTKALTHMHTDTLAPINPHTHCWIHTSTHKSWSELWGPHPDEYFLSAMAFLFATCIVFCLSVCSLTSSMPSSINDSPLSIIPASHPCCKNIAVAKVLNTTEIELHADAFW